MEGSLRPYPPPPMQWGQGPGLSAYFGPGEQGGTRFVTLLESEMPVHTHELKASMSTGDTSVPGQTAALAESTGGNAYGTTPTTTLAPQALPAAGGSLPHNNMMPSLGLNFCIALQGINAPHQ